MRGTVTEDVIQSITNLSRTNLSDLRKEMQVQEPTFDKWAKNSVKNDLNDIKFNGVSFNSDEAARYVGAVLLQAKSEGFLIATMAQDRAWCDKLFIDNQKQKDDIPFKTPIFAFMEGKLEESVYVNVEKTMTEDEKNDKDHWKHKALTAFKKNTLLKKSTVAARDFLNKKKPAASRPKNNDVDDIAGDVDITP